MKLLKLQCATTHWHFATCQVAEIGNRLGRNRQSTWTLSGQIQVQPTGQSRLQHWCSQHWAKRDHHSPFFVFTSPGKCNWRRRQRFLSALRSVHVIERASSEPSGHPTVTDVSSITTAIVASPFAIIVFRSFVHTMCADWGRRCTDVRYRRHQSVIKTAVQMTLAPGIHPPQRWPARA